MTTINEQLLLSLGNMTADFIPKGTNYHILVFPESVCEFTNKDGKSKYVELLQKEFCEALGIEGGIDNGLRSVTADLMDGSYMLDVNHLSGYRESYSVGVER